MKTLTTREWWGLGKVLGARETWRTHGALRGGPHAPFQTGRLPADWCRTLQARSHLVDYTIYSYQTPIAWHDKESGWIIPAEHYSVTTTRHQNLVRTAVSGYLHESYGE